MPVSTRRMRARWPPVDESAGGNVPMTLPSDLYWNYVRPFTPVVDRAILNKRTGSTRFYAGDRVDIEEAYRDMMDRHDGVPRIHRDPGRPDFLLISFGPRSEAPESKEEALELLRDARNAWDTKMSTIASPSMRLHNCLDMLLRIEDGWGCPLLFPGDGSIESVVQFHASMNPRSINAPSINAIPDCRLGDWVERYLCAVMGDAQMQINSLRTNVLGDVVGAYFKAGADVTPFLAPAERPLSGGSFYFRFHHPGASVFQCMEECAEDYRAAGYGIWGLSWVVAQIEKRSVANRPVLRFGVGDRVECQVEGNRWVKGRVKVQWYREDDFPPKYFAPYQIILDTGKLIYAPLDSNRTIRAST